MNASSKSPNAMLGLFCLSAGVLCYELLLMRIFSVLMWYHFASLAIGLALLGLGTGGVVVGLAHRLRDPRCDWLAAASFGAGVLIVLGFLAAVRAEPDLARTTLAPFHQPFYKPFARPGTLSGAGSLPLRLAGLALLTGLPFVGAGVATAAILSRSAPKLHVPYATTFLGSAAGCLAAPAALTQMSAPAALGLAALLAFAGAAALAPRVTARVTASGCIVLAAAAGAWAQTSGFAEIPFARGRYESNLLAVRWNPMSRVAAYPLAPGDVLRPFGLSEIYRGPIPRQIGLVVDDSGYTNLYDGEAARDNPEYFRANLVSLPYHLRPGGSTLILGPGGGKDIWIARSFPGTRVRAVEINPQVVEMVEEVFADFTQRPYSAPGVDLTVTDGRRFAAIDSRNYDVIEASAVFGRLPPAAGAFTLSEDPLHTVEAFHSYWDRLAPAGILSLTRFAYDRRALRLASLARALLDRVGVSDPGDHVRVVSDRGLANVLICRTPFSLEDDRVLSERVRALGFTFLYPSASGDSALTRIVDGVDLAASLANLPFDVSPPTDDRPFFYYTVRPRDFLRGKLPDRPGFDDRGAEILRSAFGGLAALTLLCLIAPLAVSRGVSALQARAVFPLLYAAALGFGFMAFEIGTMKRFALLLGHPIHAASATLFAFLLGGGAGSLWSRRLAGSRRALAVALAAAACLGLAQAFASPPILRSALVLSGPARWGLAALAIAPLAFVLGIGFPAGMALLGPAGREILPWAWAVNGAASVVGSLGSVLLAMNLGYTATLTVGAILYLGALCISGAFPSAGVS